MSVGGEKRSSTQGSFRANAFWSLAGTATYALAQWGTVVAFAKLGTTKTVGEYGFALAIAAPIAALTGLQLRSVHVSDVLRERSLIDYVAVRIVMGVAGTGLSVAVASCCSNSTTVCAVGLLAAGRAIDGVAEAYYAERQRDGVLRTAGLGLVINGVATIAAVSVSMILWSRLLPALLGATVGSCIALIYAVVSGGHSAGASVDRREVIFGQWSRRAVIMRHAWPLGVVVMLVSFQMNAPRYVLEAVEGPRSLALFVASTQLTTAGANVVAAICAAAAPRMARLFALGRGHEFRTYVAKLARRGFLLGAAGTLVAAIFGDKVLALVYRPEYITAWSALVWLSVAASVGYAGSFVGYGLTMARQTKVQLWLFLFVSCVAASSSMILVPRWGAVGGAWAMLCTNAVQCVASWLVLARASLRVESSAVLAVNSGAGHSA